MATSEEKQELVDHLKGPRYYRVILTGYGGEAGYIGLTPTEYDFWHSVLENHGDTDLVHYILESDFDGTFEFEDIDEIPDNAHFMKDPDVDGEFQSWYEHSEMFSHQYGVSYESAYLTVEEVDSEDFGAGALNSIVEGENLQEYLDSSMEETDWELEQVEYSDATDMSKQPENVLQIYSAEKGTFFDCVVETHGEFDKKKLKLLIEEYPNGEEVVSSLFYDEVELDNQGGDTTGKGFSAHLWKTV